ncbi:MAG: Oxidoreductase domain protein [Candidatus Woesebacteria bacterium GW2011_GWB1_41_10]|uniref:Oxidoreductase domain protein n=1 Tax=Candidatus Woesebacteria bacterium GW2011_GWB1_41_10 TaxID=1618577 RepID=A0A0G0XKJ3_9BACT|nr:MAG: Oxidoreductase domain protein [Candidatus Woesebacteria bacterium GW2011_GWB1_41_10]
MKEMDIALIGKGRWGQNYIKTIPGLIVKTRDYSEILGREDIEGVIIASATDTHFKIARDFIEKGFNVLIEKPITKTYAEALELQKLHRKNKKQIVMAGHIQIYDPGYQELKRNLVKIGIVKNLIFKGSQDQARTDSTVLENWGPHPIYMFMDLLNTSPKSVKGQERGKDNLQLDFDFDDKITATAYIGTFSPERKREFTVVGERGKLTLDWAGEKTLTLTRPDNQKTSLKFSQEKSPLEAEITEFIECIRIGKKPKTPLSQGVEVARILDLCRN